MHKALVRECGEEVPIDKILSGSESIAPSSHGPAAANLQAQANATGVAALSRFRFSTTASEI